MKLSELKLSGAYLIEHTLFEDERGYFYEWFNKREFQQKSEILFDAVQFNSSKSTKGVLRGLHYQREPQGQAKVIGVNRGTIQDVIVDLRKNSSTYGQWHSEILSGENKNKVFVPKGFAHGFLVLSDEAEIFYAIDNHYAPDYEEGLMFNDPSFAIEWNMSEDQIILSEKDLQYSLVID